MDHLSYINYFKEKAVQHLQHDSLLPDSPTGRRISFFRMNSDLEVQQSASIQIDYPYLALPVYRGRLLNTNGIVEDVMTGFIEIREKVNNPTDFEELEVKRERCKQIGFAIISSMMTELEELGSCGPIGDFDASTVQYDFTGPVNDAEYGCLFFFEMKDIAFNY